LVIVIYLLIGTCDLEFVFSSYYKLDNIMRVLLINPFYPISETPSPPLGLAFLASALEAVRNTIASPGTGFSGIGPGSGWGGSQNPGSGGLPL
jgi:hypothetical protein